MLLLDITVVNVALPNIDKELHTSFTDLQWVVDAYALTLAATLLNAGSLGDIRGRKRVFLGGIALFTLASALCGAATSPLWLILARGVQGIGGAAMFAVSLAIISQEFFGREGGPSGSGERPWGRRWRSGLSSAARSPRTSAGAGSSSSTSRSAWRAWRSGCVCCTRRATSRPVASTCQAFSR